MRLYKHLTEKSIQEEGIEDFWKLVQKKCKPFLKEWMPIQKTGEMFPLYRGMNEQDAGEKWVRQDRKPEMSGRKFHTDVDNMMKQVHGVNGRTKAMFCTGDASATTAYGDAFMVFPVGRYKYLWSGRIRDLYIDASKYGYHPNMMDWIVSTARKMNIDIYDPKEGSKAQKELRKMGQAQNTQALRDMMKYYYTKDLRKAIRSENEIMVQCESYLYLKDNWFMELEALVIA